MLQCVGVELKKFHSAFATTMPSLQLQSFKAFRVHFIECTTYPFTFCRKNHYKSITITSGDAPADDDDGDSNDVDDHTDEDSDDDNYCNHHHDYAADGDYVPATST